MMDRSPAKTQASPRPDLNMCGIVIRRRVLASRTAEAASPCEHRGGV